MEADIHCVTEKKQVKRTPMGLLIKMLSLSAKSLLFLLVATIAYNFWVMTSRESIKRLKASYDNEKQVRLPF